MSPLMPDPEPLRLEHGDGEPVPSQRADPSPEWYETRHRQMARKLAHYRRNIRQLQRAHDRATAAHNESLLRIRDLRRQLLDANVALGEARSRARPASEDAGLPPWLADLLGDFAKVLVVLLVVAFVIALWVTR